MQRQSTIAAWCDRIIEGGWLLALVLIPSYFNLLSSRHFEPDKATTLRAIVLVMLAAAFIRWLEHLGAAQTPSEPRGSLRVWQRVSAFPMAVPMLVYTLVFLLATVVSVVPGTSFWGSYQRLQGTYTNLSYVALAAMIMTHLRRREQLDRLITALILGSLPAVGYGLIQHFQIDPLPWRGDVVSRVASTMGNSIFVAAYLIMVLPFALYRGIAALYEARKAEPSRAPGAEWGWAIAYALLVIGALLIVFAAMQFGAVVRTSDLRYWWIYPGALVAAFGLFLIPTLGLHRMEETRAGAIWAGVLALLYVLLVGVFFSLGQSAGDQVVQASPGRIGTGWPLWMIGGVLLVMAAYGLFFMLRRPLMPSRLLLNLQAIVMLLVASLLLVTVFFTQSRGPWIGGATGLFVFFTLLLILARSRARANNDPRARLWSGLLIAEIILALLLGGFIAVFNYSNTPFFEQLRKTPYIGRMGTLLEVDSGTGLVRRLIWIGDDKAGGAVALITSDPVRAIVGWGPESMFVAYNRFYPPALANIESRGASPDRSHEAYLDELINKGVLGLISYLFVLFSFYGLAWRLLKRVDSWQMQVLFVACVAAVSAHVVEGLTGIPIVATLMVLWLSIAILVVAGMLAGQYSLEALEPVAAPEPIQPEPVAPPAPKGQNQRTGKRRQGQGSVARGASQNRTPYRAARSGGAAVIAIYAVIALLALVAVWSFNVDNVYADMRFQQGQNYAEGSNANLDQHIIGASYYLDAIRMEPDQDFYYLNLGRSLMSIVDIQRQLNPGALGQVKSDAQVADLLRLQEPRDVQDFVTRRSPLELMSYARVVLEHARNLSPLNKDHYANLARMHSFWYSRITREPERLQDAVNWYQRGHEIAPQDVTVLNEYASAVGLLGNVTEDPAAKAALFEQANQLVVKSRSLDPLYADTTIREADLLRLQGRSAEAVDRYVAMIEKNPHALDNQISPIIESLRNQPEQLKRLRNSYDEALTKKPDDVALQALVGLMSARAGDLPRAADAFGAIIQLQPQNLEARQNYTLVLSDMQQYRQAADEAQKLLTMAQQQQISEQDRASLSALLKYLQDRAQGQ